MSGKKMAVALSGGVDSSVVALLLREEGHEVQGLYMRLGESPVFEYREHQAERICQALGIPFQSINLGREFEHHVIDYFCREYRRGRTPNPCIACNQQVKFGLLLKEAISRGFAYLATGHYARIEWREGRFHLLRGRDAARDQSYFLYTLTQEKLEHVLFPLGDMGKGEVEEMARREGLPVSAKPSQDICFVSRKNYRAFLARRFAGAPGEIMDTRGRVLGSHRGIAFYTVGQRHGMGVSGGEPLYVLRVEPECNRLVLGERRELQESCIEVSNLNWVSGEIPAKPLIVNARIRYRAREAEATLYPAHRYEVELQGEGEKEEDVSTVCFTRPQRAIAPGQSVAFYRGEEVLGGGIIERAKPSGKGGEYVAAARQGQ